MALWLVRAGQYGEHEHRFFQDNRIYLTWEALTETNLSGAHDYDAIRALMDQHYPGEPTRLIGNWSGQVWDFALAMQPGDWVVVPRKSKGSIAVGEIQSGYTFVNGQDAMYHHFRTVQWLSTDVPRSAFDQDLLYSPGAGMTVCEMERNDGEKRIRAMAKKGWHAMLALPTPSGIALSDLSTDDEEAQIDLEQQPRDATVKVIIQKCKSHGMACMVEAVLKAQGFTTYLSPEGPDNGIDILAAGGSFAFDRPRICAQAKSGDTSADRPNFTQLIGSRPSVAADQGLFVSWSSFKNTVLKEVPTQFFKVRVWNQKDLLNNCSTTTTSGTRTSRLNCPSSACGP